MTRAAIFGPGSWGTAFAMVLADSGTEPVLCSRRAELAQRIEAEHENPDYLRMRSVMTRSHFGFCTRTHVKTFSSQIRASKD